MQLARGLSAGWGSLHGVSKRYTSDLRFIKLSLMLHAAESGSAGAAANDIISKAMRGKGEATEEPLSTGGEQSSDSSDDLIPGIAP